jgi:hypothetical protein
MGTPNHILLSRMMESELPSDLKRKVIVPRMRIAEVLGFIGTIEAVEQERGGLPLISEVAAKMGTDFDAIMDLVTEVNRQKRKVRVEIGGKGQNRHLFVVRNEGK